MKLNFINNYKTIYYNLLVNFYLVLNNFIPLYNDVIISMQLESMKNLVSNFRKLKNSRMIEYLKKLENTNKILLDKNKNIIIIEYDYTYSVNSSDESDESEDEVKNEIKLLLKDKKFS
jgi:hypothetical protein